MKCKDCRFWKRIVVSDDKVVTWGHFFKWKPPVSNDYRVKVCQLCGEEFDVSNYGIDFSILTDHCIDKHFDEVNRLRVIRLGECSNKHFIYPNDYHFSKNGNAEIVSGALYYGDAEEYNAWFETDEEFGCIHFDTKT